MHVTEVCERIVVLEKGQIVKDIVTAPATLKELESVVMSHGYNQDCDFPRMRNWKDIYEYIEGI